MPTKVKKTDFHGGVGRRKEAVAQIRLISGRGEYMVNGKETTIPLELERLLTILDKSGQMNISALVRGGGHHGQITAICLGVARAFVELNPDYKSTLRKAGYLTVDARVKERKKPGLKRARRAPQWAKR